MPDRRRTVIHRETHSGRHSENAFTTARNASKCDRVALVVEFDRRFLAAVSQADFYALADWADEHRLTLAKKARDAAKASAGAQT